MNRRKFLRRAGGATVGLAGPAAWLLARGAQPAPTRERLNFVFILIDDLGWADLRCYGSTFHDTPHLDRLATQGMKFTDAYAAGPVCSPTRASILTGKYPATVNLTDFIAGHWRPYARLVVPTFNLHLPLEEVTIAEALKAAGYATGYFGKWHLGGGAQFAPSRHGFDEVAQRAPNRNDKMVDGLTTRAEAFIERNRDRPFFLYLSHYTVHIPLQARRELVQKYEARARAAGGRAQSHPAYAAMVETMDESVGRILAKLDQLALADRTVVVFTSDNGGLIRIFHGRGSRVTSNAPLRSEKGTLYEGGIRVPTIIRWPGSARPGTVCSVPVSSVDFYPTLLEMAGVRPDPRHRPDGKSLVPLLRQSGPLRRDAIYWHYPHYHHTSPCGAVRSGNDKLIEYFEDDRLELYDLRADIGESRDLAQTNPARAAELRRLLQQWRRAVGARMPTPNPNHDPQRAGEWGRRRRRPPRPPAKKGK